MNDETSSSAPPARLTPPPRGSELLRENLFEEPAPEDAGELLRRREPTMLRKGKKLVAPIANNSRKYTVVFDLDETVVYARDGPLYARAYLKDLFRALHHKVEVIVWTAGERDYAKCILEEINEDHIIEHLVYRHERWFHEGDYTKDLRQLGRELEYTIMIENTPDCVRANPQNGIIVEDFEVVPDEAATDEETPSSPPSRSATPTPLSRDGVAPVFPDAPLATVDGEGGKGPSFSPAKGRRKHTDRTLILLRELLLAMADSGKPVPEFLASCDLLSQQTVEGSNGEDIVIYHLGTRRRRKDAGTPRKTVKLNRDRIPIHADEKSGLTEGETEEPSAKRVRMETSERDAPTTEKKAQD